MILIVSFLRIVQPSHTEIYFFLTSSEIIHYLYIYYITIKLIKYFI